MQAFLPTTYLLPHQQNRNLQRTPYRQPRYHLPNSSPSSCPSPLFSPIAKRSVITACIPRPETNHTEPSFLPQTIEYAICESQRATRDALCAGLTNLRIELPMGRSRAHWYAMSPIDTWYPEVSVLVFHYAELFKGLNISLILGTGPGVTHPVNWITDLRRLEDEPPPRTPDSYVSFDQNSSSPDLSSRRVVIFAGISAAQHDLFEKRLQQEIDHAEAVIIFCSFLDVPLSNPIHHQTFACKHFEIPYFCRAYNKSAVLRDAHNAPWSIFIEIAVFEYEWIGNREHSDQWIPTQETIERFVSSRGAYQKKTKPYMATDYSGCEAGFWPFMTVCCRNVLPLDGRILERERRLKKEKNKARPFGFF